MKHALLLLLFLLFILACTTEEDDPIIIGPEQPEEIVEPEQPEEKTAENFDIAPENYRISSISDIGEFVYIDDILTKIGNDTLLYNTEGELIKIVRLGNLDDTSVVIYSLILERSMNTITVHLDTLSDLNTTLSDPDIIPPSSLTLGNYELNDDSFISSITQVNFNPLENARNFSRADYEYDVDNNIQEIVFHDYIPPEFSPNSLGIHRVRKSFIYLESKNPMNLLDRRNFQFNPSLDLLAFSYHNPSIQIELGISEENKPTGGRSFRFEYECNEFGYPTLISKIGLDESGRFETGEVASRMITYE